MSVSSARAMAFDILMAVEQRDAYASELLHSERLTPLSAADRGLCMELVMGVLRWRALLDDAIATTSGKPLERLDPEVRVALEIGIYQFIFLQRVPARAAVNESVELVKRARKRSAVPFANAVLRKAAELPMTPQPPPSGAGARELAKAYSHPRWLVERWVATFGPLATQRICAANQKIPETAIRIDDPAVLDELAAEGIALEPGLLVTSARRVVAGDVTQTKAFSEGRVAIQDEASQLVALMVGRGSKLLDCCAAPGSKTAALAVANPKARIVAAEIHPHRAALLRKRVPHEHVEVLTANATELPYGAEFDRVLADVPCSGTGTLARNPEIKWKLKIEDLADLQQRQRAILKAALGHLAAGGKLVYSTCSLEPEENAGVVEEVLSSVHGFRVLEASEELETLRSSGALAWNDIASLTRGRYLRTLPGVHAGEGFFAAIIQRD